MALDPFDPYKRHSNLAFIAGRDNTGALLRHPLMVPQLKERAMRLGKRERAAKKERLKLAGERLVRIRAEVPQIWGGAYSPKPIRANGAGPAYRWPIVGKCRLNPQRRSLVTRKAGLLDSLANIAKNGVRLKFELGRTTYPKELEAANILLGD